MSPCFRRNWCGANTKPAYHPPFSSWNTVCWQRSLFQPVTLMRKQVPCLASLNIPRRLPVLVLVLVLFGCVVPLTAVPHLLPNLLPRVLHVAAHLLGCASHLTHLKRGGGGKGNGLVAGGRKHNIDTRYHRPASRPRLRGEWRGGGQGFLDRRTTEWWRYSGASGYRDRWRYMASGVSGQ